MSLPSEFKAKKAKFGFNLGQLRLSNVHEFSNFLEFVQSEYVEGDDYVVEESGWNPSTVVKLYTDKDEVANFIRSYKP